MKLYNFVIKNYKIIIFILIILNLLLPLKPKAYDFTNLSSFEFIDMYYEYNGQTFISIQQECDTFNSSGQCLFNSASTNQWPLDNYNFKLFNYSGYNLKSGEEYQLTFYIYANKDILQYLRNANVTLRLFTSKTQYTTINDFNLSISKDGYQYKYVVTFTANTSSAIGFAFNNILSTRFSPTSGTDTSVFDLGLYKYYDLKQLSQDFTGVIDEIQGTNDRLDGIQDSITDSSGPSEEDLNVLNGASGWLPPGPIDSILTLPLTMMESISNNLGKECSPLEFTLPYINKKIYLPCFNSFIYNTNFDTLWNWFGTIAGAFLLYYYLLSLYKWVDNTLQFRENNYIDNWGGV